MPSRRRLCLESLEDRRMLHHGSHLPEGFTEVEVATVVQPRSMDIAFDDRIFVAERQGTVRVIKNDRLLDTPFLELDDVDFQGENGLNSVVLDPRFHENNYVYVFYTLNDSPTQRHNRVSRFTANGDVAEPGSELVLIDLEPLNDSRVHNGAAMAFGADGKLYVGVGDNRIPSNSQSLDTRLGSLLRINPDGTIPEDNPFFDTATGDNRAIWATGLRNPFTMDVQPGTGRIFINDVGAGSFEEVNEGIAGANYGFPLVEGPGGTPPFLDPVIAYAHGPGDDEGCAITGGAFYNPQVTQFPAEFTGDYFFMDFCNGWIRRYDPDDGTVTPFAEDIAGFPVDLEVDNNGSLYYLSIEEHALFRIDKPGDFPPDIVLHPEDQTAAIDQSATFTVSAAGSGPLAFQWERDGEPIPGATANAYTIPKVSAADGAAEFRVVVSNSFGNATSHNARLSIIPGSVPTASISAPDTSLTYDAGDTIYFAGIGIDPEDGDLPTQALTWRVDFHHDVHFHPFMPETVGLAGGSFTISEIGEPSANVWFRIHLTVEDSDGLTHSTFRDVFPNTSLMSFTSNVPGIQFTLDGRELDTPTAVEGVANAARELGTYSPQTIDGDVYQFLSWSDERDQSHPISTPPTDTTYLLLFGARRIDPFDSGYSETGSWQEGVGAGASGTTRVSTDPDASATWTPVVRSGFHHVSVHRDSNAANTDTAIITLFHNQQTEVRTLDLSSGETGWVYLGRFFFDGTGSEYVSIRNGGSGELVADSVEFHNGDEFDEELVAYLSFDEGTGTVAADRSPNGNENSGILHNGAAWSPFGRNGAVHLDGAASMVEIPNTTDINQQTLDELTVATWFRVEDASISNRKQLIYEHGGASRGLNIYIYDGRLYVAAWNDSVEGWAGTFLSSEPIQSGTWHHVALVLDGSNTLQPDALAGYLDGVAFGTGEATRWVFHGGGIGLGRANGQTRFHDGLPPGNQSGFAGEIDETLVYQRALTAREVQFLSRELIVREFVVDSIQDAADSDPGDGVCQDESGSCTLRAAIQEANASPNRFGPDVTLFNISGFGLHTIRLDSPLPRIVEPLVIDATSQPGFAGVPLVELDGSQAGPKASGIVVTAGASTVRGLSVTRFSGSGVVLAHGGGNTIEQNHIGTSLSGIANQGNGIHGVLVFDSPANTIGGTSPETANVISGNDLHGVLLTGIRTIRNVVDSNIIGLAQDGTNQLKNGGVGVRVLRGASRNTIGASGNVISGNGSDGVRISGAGTSNNTVAGNFIGTDVTGGMDRGNAEAGVVVRDASGNHIGTAGNGNVISGNGTNGVVVVGTAANGNWVQGNLIGVDLAGATALPNAQAGLNLFNASNTTIGGTTTGAGNVISGNTTHGVFVSGANAQHNHLEGNLIGTNRDGTAAVANGQAGVILRNSPNNTIGGSSVAAGNVISANAASGVVILGTRAVGNLVAANLIGTDATGSVDLGNAGAGVLVLSSENRIGGTAVAERNLISGNDFAGVSIGDAQAANNLVLGNYIGTNLVGTSALGNRIGVYVSAGEDNAIGDAAVGAGNIISGNTTHGVLLANARTANNAVSGNLIGTDLTGTVALGNAANGVSVFHAPSNTIGGKATGAGNVISGNGTYGVSIFGADASSNNVQGNSIGTDITGTRDLGNVSSGVFVSAPGNIIGGTLPGAGNLISGNGFVGVRINGALASGNSVAGNLIGTQVDGTSPLGNTTEGVRIDNASNNEIGGSVAGAGNVIAHQSRHGVVVLGASVGNAIERNSMFSNAGLGIDLNLDGASANDTQNGNDSDAGPNNLQNTPVVTEAILSGNQLHVAYSVPSDADHSAYPLTIEFFLADSVGQEGQTFLGMAPMASEGPATVLVDVTGLGVSGSSRIVATATDAEGNSSEFSGSIPVALPLLAASKSQANSGEPAPPTGRASQADSREVHGAAACCDYNGDSLIDAADLATLHDSLPPIVEAGISRWQAAGLDSQQLSRLGSMQIQFADLGGAYLGLTADTTVLLDTHAAGYGWYIDVTPRNDFESDVPPLPAESGDRRDLLAAVMHEMGHVLGLEDVLEANVAEDVMLAWLQAGPAWRLH